MSSNKGKRYNQEQIIRVLREVDNGTTKARHISHAIQQYPAILGQ